VKEEAVSRSLSRRTLLEMVIHGLGVTLALGHVIPPVHAEEGDDSKNEADHLIVHVARQIGARDLVAGATFFVPSLETLSSLKQ
jgi:hypothetical protein